MRGHLQERGPSSWRLKVFLGRSPDGKRRYLERTFRGSRREAERELARLVVEVDEGRWVPAAPMTMAELIERWLTVKALQVEESTLNGYRWIARAYVLPEFGSRKVVTLRTLELDQWYASLRTSGGRDGKPLSARTVRLCHTVVSQSLEQARRWGLISRSPARDASPPSGTRTEVSPPSPAQTRLLIAAAFEEDPDFGVYLWVLAVTGCRRGEGCALRWRDLSVERGELHIRRSIAHVGAEVREKDTKTHQSRRVALDAGTLELLREHHQKAVEVAFRLGVRLADDAYMFSETGDGSRPWRPDVCTNWFGRLRRRLYLDRVRLHDLRHFMATELGQAGTPIATISARLGHRDKATTLNIYSHALPAADSQAAEVMGSLLSGPVNSLG